MAVIVMGVSGCGKTTVGALLAEALGCRFIEGDTLHDAAAIEKMRGGIPLTDADRWPWLDRVIQDAARALATDDVVVVACSALKRAYRDRLRAIPASSVHFIMLDNHRNEILERLSARAHEFMPATLLDSQLATLERPAPDESATVLLSDRSPAMLCDMAVSWLRANAMAG